MTITISSCFKIGDLVLVNGLLKAWIVEKNKFNDTVTFTLKYMLGGQLEHNVPLEIVSVIEMYGNEVSTNRSGITRAGNFEQQVPIQPPENDSNRLNSSSVSNQSNDNQTSNLNNSDTVETEPEDPSNLKDVQ